MATRPLYPAPTASLVLHELTTEWRAQNMLTYSMNEALLDPFWGIQVANGSRLDFRTVYIWEDGCPTKEGWDCTAYCLDPGFADILWNTDPEWLNWSIHNCMVYPFISLALATGNLIQSTGSNSNQTLTEKYNIFPESSPDFWNTTAGWNNVAACLEAYCPIQLDSTSQCTGPDDSWRVDYLRNGWYKLVGDITMTPWYDTGFCWNAWINSLDPDIGGIGVLISYYMQIAILFSAYLAQSIMRTWIKWPTFVLVFLATLLSMQGLSVSQITRRAHRTADRMQNKFSLESHRPAFVSGLVEFQKTQVFFLLTVEIATLLGLYRLAFTQASTWSQIALNRAFFGIVGASGVDPVLLNLMMLRKVQKASMYLICWSAICVAISLWVLFRAALTPDPSIVSVSPPITNIPACGNISPEFTCVLGALGYRPTVSSAVLSLVASVLILGTLLLEKLMVFGKDKSGKPTNILQLSRSAVSVVVGRRAGNAVGALYALSFLAAEVWLLYRNTYQMIRYNIYLVDPRVQASRTWTLGQVIAVAVWVPVLIEYLYLSIRGMKRGFLYRLVYPWVVTKIDDNSNANGNNSVTPIHSNASSQGLANPSNVALADLSNAGFLAPGSTHPNGTSNTGSSSNISTGTYNFQPSMAGASTHLLDPTVPVAEGAEDGVAASASGFELSSAQHQASPYIESDHAETEIAQERFRGHAA